MVYVSDSEDSTVTVHWQISSPFEMVSVHGSPRESMEVLPGHYYAAAEPMLPLQVMACIMSLPPIPLNTYLAPSVHHRLDLHTWSEEPQSPPSLEFVPKPIVPCEYIPQEDEILPAEEQPLLAAASPTADPPGYVPESDLEEELEEDDEDPEEDPADYPADRNDDDDEEEEEEHPAPADSVPPVHCMTARISIRDEPSISLPPRE
ncbi:hypothetical protein Tco_0251803 [Tanacetum coccineum]